MAAAESTSELSDLLSQLRQLERRVRLVALINGLGLAALFIAAVVALAVVADTIWDLPLQVRIGLLVTASLVALWGILRAIGRSFLRRSDPAATAALVESAYPGLHERLSSAIEWERDSSAGGSALMRALVVEQAGRSLSDLDLAAPLPMSRASRRGVIGVGALAALLVPCLFFAGYRLTLQRFATPWRNLERVSNLYLNVSPGDASVARGSDVEITATPRWRFAKTEVDRATLHWHDSTGKAYERQMTWQPDRDAFVATVAHVLEPFQFEIAAGNSRTREFQIEVVDRPVLTSVTASVEPPPYSGRAVEQIEGAVGELELLAGSSVRFGLQFNLPVAAVELHWMPDAGADAAAESATILPASIAADGLSAEVGFTPDRSGRFEFSLSDVVGPVELLEPQRRIRLIDDASPTVVFTDRAAARARRRDVLRIPVAATDDIGLAELELHWQVVGQVDTVNHTEADVPLLGVRSVEHEFRLDLRPLNLTDGAVISVRARAADERPDPGPNETWTEPRLITIADQSDPYESESLTDQQQQLSQSLQHLRAAVEKNLTTTDELRSDAAARNAAVQSFERDADVADLASADQLTVDDAEQLAAQLDLHPLLASLGERTRNIGRQQLTAAKTQTAAAHEAPLAEKAPALGKAFDELTQAKLELDALQRDLEQLAELELDLLELQRLADDADQLAKDVARLKQTEDAAADRPPTDQPDAQEQLRAMAADQLRMDHADLSQRLDHLIERRPELLDAAAEHSLDRLSELRDQALQLAAGEQQLATVLESEAEPASAQSDAETKQIDELRKQQAAMVEQAVQQMLDAAESPTADQEALAEIATKAGSAADALNAGDLNTAAQAARQSAERATAAAEAAQSGNDSLREYAAEQAKVAEQLSTAATSPPTRAAARQQSQQRLTENAQQLEQQFQQIADELTAEPVTRTDDGARATGSGAATRQAQESMAASAAAQSASELAAAATAAREAVQHLEVAAEQVLPALENAPDSPVPTEVGQQVAQASRQLRRAGEQLTGIDQPKNGDESAEGAEQASRDGAESKSEQGEGDEQSPSKEGEGEENEQGEGNGDAQGESDDLAQAADALQKAAQQIKPRKPGDRDASSEQMAGQQQGESKESNPAADGFGNSETARLTELAAKLKARSARNWGELPGELKSELQQRTQSRPDADYAPLIRMYFDEISRRPSPSPDSPPQP